MGRQTGFYALPDDLRAFLDFACQRDPVEVTLRDSDRPEVEPLSSPETETRTMTLWRRDLTPDLRRKPVARDFGDNYYRVEISLPVLELSPSKAGQWAGRPVLLIGRVYGFDFSVGPEAYVRWFEALQRWIRSHFVKSPVGDRYGYVGEAALEWFRQGGILLPAGARSALSTVPPQWQSFIDDQDKVRASLIPAVP